MSDQDIHELEELEPIEEAPAAAPAGARAERGAPRELERAPLVLRKAALLLTVAALFPWLAKGGFDPLRLAGKVVVLLGGWILMQGVLYTHGEEQKVPGFLHGLGKLHPLALDVLGGLVMLAGVLVPNLGGLSFPSVVEKCAVGVGFAAWCQVLAYEKGGKFNPVMGLVIPFIGVASAMRIVTVFTDQAGFDALALLGAIGVTAAAVIAGHTMVIAMKEAKAHGEAKKRAALEARKAARSAKR
jgi:hypothetical protein